jgi:hypothetical protein
MNLRGGEMEIAIVAGLLAKRDMKVNTCHKDLSNFIEYMPVNYLLNKWQN